MSQNLTKPNQGQTLQALYGTTSPVSGGAPASADVGQQLSNLRAISVVVSVPVGITLSGAGTLQCYIQDPGYLSPNGNANAVSNTGTTINYNTTQQAFEVGMTVTGLTSGATGVVTSLTSSILTCSGGVTGTVTAGEQLRGVAAPRWIRLPDMDLTVTQSGVQDQIFQSVLVQTPRSRGVALWVPSGVTFSSGAGGVIVTQLGQTGTEFAQFGNGS